MKRGKLYTVNKWNRPAFIPPNLFGEGGPYDWNSYTIQDGFGVGDNTNTTTAPAGGPYKSVAASVLPSATSLLPKVTDLKLKAPKVNVPAPKGGLGKIGAGSMAGAGINAAAGIVGGLANKGISGGLSSKAGSAISGIGSTVGGAIGSVNPVAGAIVTVGSQVLGGLTNRAFGTSVNQAALKAANEGTNYLSNFTSKASSFDDVKGPNAVLAITDPYKGGWFSSSKAKRKNQALRDARIDARQNAYNAVDNNIYNLQDDQMNNAMANYSAFGGPLDMIGNNNMGATEYGLLSDYMNMKNTQTQAKNNTVGYLGAIPSEPMTFANGGGIHIKKSHEGLFTEQANRAGMGVQEYAAHVLANKDKYPANTVKRANFARNASNWHGFGGCLGNTLFALGGDMQANGSDFTDGLVTINAGNTHENNPYQGVQMGIAPDGSPNLVEENETVFDDFVFSNRINVDNDTKKKFHIGKNRKLTYADLSKKLESEAKERPNDPISQAALKSQMRDLAEAQETQKAKEEAERARKAFEALSPEEQAAVIQQIQAQQQAPDEQQEGQPEDQQEVPVDENGNPVEQPTEEELAAQQPAEEVPQEEGITAAYGGNLHKFAPGGPKLNARDLLIKALGLHTIGDFDRWSSDNGFDAGDVDWDNYDLSSIKKNSNLMQAITKAAPALADAISHGYDFGRYTPEEINKLTFDFKHGGWGSEDYNAWNGSTDTAWKEAIEKGLVKEGMSGEEIGKALMQTDAYKRGTSWLQESEGNRLKYLQAILNSDAPEAARKYAEKYVTKDGWKKDKPRDYDTIFKDVRTTHPGTYWKTPEELVRQAQAKNFAIGDDGTVEEIVGDVPKEWALANTYTWKDPTSDFTYKYFKRPVANTGSATTPKEDNKLQPKPDWMRYAGLAGPAVGLGLWAAGVGKPDYSGLDSAMNYARQANAQATYTPIGNYRRYVPLDIWAEQNRMDANSRATDRAVMNTGIPTTSKMVSLIANGYNSQLGSGDLAIKARQYNDAMQKDVAEFNRDTDKFNADAFNKVSMANAEMRNKNAQFNANLQASLAGQRMNADANWYNALYGNVGNIFKGLSDLGKENAQWNTLAALANTGAFGVPSKYAQAFSGSSKALNDANKATSAARGGRINKKKGLTF